MTQEDESNGFLPENKLDEDKLSIEIPAQQMPIHPDRIPSGYDPMGEIQLRGQASRRLAGGQVPGWVLLTSWIIFGSFALIMTYVAITSSSFVAWMTLAIALIPLFILWKGTKAKASNRRRRRE
jgi:hypothetical protein